MVELFGRHWTRTALLQRIGDVSQLGGARLVTLSEGPESGVQVAEVRTGSGLAFSVLPGRGMDLGLGPDIFDSFLKYQAMMAQQFKRLQATYGFHIIDAHRPVELINVELRKKIGAILAGHKLH